MRYLVILLGASIIMCVRGSLIDSTLTYFPRQWHFKRKYKSNSSVILSNDFEDQRVTSRHRGLTCTKILRVLVLETLTGTCDRQRGDFRQCKRKSRILPTGIPYIRAMVKDKNKNIQANVF